jgi:mannan endo-1,4-beta-mannosidase
MKTIILTALATLCFMLIGCSATSTQAPTLTALTDPQATPQTQALYRNLLALQGQHVLFGHQDTLAYGMHWQAELDRSDVKDVTGSFPAVSGWDLGLLEQDSPVNLDGVSFELMQESIKRSYLRGGVTTLSWHMINPVTGGPYSDTSAPAAAELLPGGARHALFTSYLDKFVAFNEKLVVDGVQVPIIFRPWHEHNGEWFWWGKTHVSESDYIKLWRFTVDYLRNEKQQHNLIIAFSPDRSRTQIETIEQDYFYGYPGDDYVDVIGLDNYWDLGHSANTASAAEQLRNFGLSLAAIGKIARTKGKVAALTEGGLEAIPHPDFWTQVMLAGINFNPDAQRVAWVMVWRNATHGGFNDQHFYAPYPGHKSADDFVKFKEDARVLFEDELPSMYR